MSATHIRFNDQEDDEYALSDSEEEEFTEHQKQLLKKARNRQEAHSESEEEVFGVYSDTSSDIALSDVEGQDNGNDLPNIRAWGKDKKRFYSTDYVDPDYGGYQGKDAELADLEEEEAKNLQKQLLQQLDDDDFCLDFVNKDSKVEEKREAEEIVKTDISKLSKRQKVDLLLKESPEFFGLVEDFKNKLRLACDFLCPILQLSKNNKIQTSEALNFVQTYYEIILNYSTNINMYLLLKASRVNIQIHPVVKRLYQYRQLLAQLDPIFEEVVKPQIEVLINTFKNEANKGASVTKKKTLKILKKSLKPTQSIEVPEMEEAEPAKKKTKHDFNAISDKNMKTDLGNDEESSIANEESDDKNIENKERDARRSITYQIAKNKGLTPHRNKLQRNPRVKHRNKYRRAKIRRKGAVREVRTEVTRYAGELSGIKTSVTKSIKIKS